VVHHTLRTPRIEIPQKVNHGKGTTGQGGNEQEIIAIIINNNSNNNNNNNGLLYPLPSGVDKQ